VHTASDRELILLLQEGDLDALGELYDRHHKRVYRTALGITSDQDAASDLLQDVFLRINRFSHRIDPDRPLEPWLYRVTANLAYTWLNRRSRWYRYLMELGDWLTRERRPGPQKQVENEETITTLRKAVAALPPKQRTVVVLFYMNDVSVEEISAILEIPEGTVKSRLYYARRALRERLEQKPRLVTRVGYEYN
jgi:RNA polymerase sigma-70 factor (ECF subfamily)